MACTEYALPGNIVDDGDWMDDIDDRYVGQQTDEDWLVGYERRCEEEMLNSVDTVMHMIRTEELQEYGEYDWDGRFDDVETTVLVKSLPRRTRPSKRQLHPVDSNCFRLRQRRSEKRFTFKRMRRQQRRTGHDEVVAQLSSTSIEVTSVSEGLPPDVTPEFSCLSRSYAIDFRDDGTIAYIYDVDHTPVILRRDVRFRMLRPIG